MGMIKMRFLEAGLGLCLLFLYTGCNQQQAAGDVFEVSTTLPAATTRELDEKAAILFVQSKDTKTLSDRKTAVEQALSLAGISGAMRTILEKERDTIIQEEKKIASRTAKPRTSFQAVSIPKQKPQARFGVNFNELMNTVNEAGITKDPFVQ